MGGSPDEVIFEKNVQEIGLLETKCSHKKMNLSIKNIITDKKFILSLIKIKKQHHFSHYNQVQVVMEITVLKWHHFVIYVYGGMNFVKVNFDRYCFKSVIEKMDEYYMYTLQAKTSFWTILNNFSSQNKGF